ncbi:hypothetical protein BLL52_1236 [Rhodoferax antarcticus ANT.BR]|uniref:Uncharacterized protein n=1 Tax=Rhodoferax antarcticus ANT.BR TaxID=1111071 RepID=A0A1Q8YHD6_9BURK|nr:hypothetical protein BLL52_1236 [Rhodoferax antarcticus ANT.BR]
MLARACHSRPAGADDSQDASLTRAQPGQQALPGTPASAASKGFMPECPQCKQLKT